MDELTNRVMTVAALGRRGMEIEQAMGRARELHADPAYTEELERRRQALRALDAKTLVERGHLAGLFPEELGDVEALARHEAAQALSGRVE
ncbi:MAG: hypothetical protein RLO52_34595 [Sandaracinaceae bacterium]